nr:hypothetical protein [Photobacterium damselae]
MAASGVSSSEQLYKEALSDSGALGSGMSVSDVSVVSGSPRVSGSTLSSNRGGTAVLFKLNARFSSRASNKTSGITNVFFGRVIATYNEYKSDSANGLPSWNAEIRDLKSSQSITWSYSKPLLKCVVVNTNLAVFSVNCAHQLKADKSVWALSVSSSSRAAKYLDIRYYSSESLVTKGLRANFGLFAEMGAKPLIRVSKFISLGRGI